MRFFFVAAVLGLGFGAAGAFAQQNTFPCHHLVAPHATKFIKWSYGQDTVISKLEIPYYDPREHEYLVEIRHNKRSGFSQVIVSFEQSINPRNGMTQKTCDHFLSSFRN